MLDTCVTAVKGGFKDNSLVDPVVRFTSKPPLPITVTYCTRQTNVSVVFALFFSQTFAGNIDGTSVVRRRLLNPIETRFVRLKILTAHRGVNNKACLRMEIYGCAQGKSTTLSPASFR